MSQFPTPSAMLSKLLELENQIDTASHQSRRVISELEILTRKLNLLRTEITHRDQPPVSN